MVKNDNIPRNVQRDLNNLVNQKMKLVKSDFDKTIRVVNNEMYDEATNMFDTFISQYYKYKTKVYIRHWEGKPGTQEGQNLYFGKNIIKNTKRITLTVDTDTFGKNGLMADDYEYDSAFNVFQNVLYGYRGVPGVWIKTWEGTYKGKYFQYSGEMKNAFDLFNLYFDDIIEPLFYKLWEKQGY